MSDVAAAPLRIAEIESFAWQLRTNFGLHQQNYFPLLHFLENVVTRLFPDFEYEIKDDAEMGSIEGMNCLGQRKIILPQSVYDKACAGDGRARFTIAHELGHLFMHPKERLSLNRGNGKLAAFIDPEWQANQFAACLLMPERLIRTCRDVSTVIAAFGVSTQAAEYRMRRLNIRITEGV